MLILLVLLLLALGAALWHWIRPSLWLRGRRVSGTRPPPVGMDDLVRAYGGEGL